VFADNEVPPRFGELTIRALHPRGEVDEALPIVITPGWPSTVLEVLPLAQRLAWPSQYGGAAADAPVRAWLPGWRPAIRSASSGRTSRSNVLWPELPGAELATRPSDAVLDDQQHRDLVPALSRRPSPAGKAPVGQDITVLVSFYLPPDDIGGIPPCEFVARQYRIVGWTEFPRGGHLMASEESDLLAGGVRKAFRDSLSPLR
jgi:hypothetical protein